MIRIDIDDYGDLSEIFEALEILAVKTRSHEAIRLRNFGALAEELGVWDALNRIFNEVGLVLRWKLTGAVEELPDNRYKTIADLLGGGEGVRRGVVEHMDETRLMAVVQAVPKPRVSFRYVAEGREIAFEKASEGQRAAALLMMLLRQKGGPLIIDQPESDLDNSVVSRIVELAHEVKMNRQIIMVSHNANLVVNASADLVVCMDNDDQGRRVARSVGVIDWADMREAIIKTTEGGEQAFRDRQRKYGF